MKDAIKDTLYFCRNHQGGIATLLAPYFILMLAINVIGRMLADSIPIFVWAGHAALILIQPLYTGRLIKYIDNAVNDSEHPLTINVQEWLRLLLVSLIAGLATAFGFVLLIVPGIIVATRFGFAEFAAVLAHKEPFDSLKTSWVDSQSHFWHLLGGGVLFGGISFLLSIFIYMGSPDSALGILLTESVGLLVSFLFMALITVFFFRVYDGVQSSDHP